MALQRFQTRCCGKKRFATREAAEAALFRIARVARQDEYPRRAYQCPRGWWHLTKRVKSTDPTITTDGLVMKRDKYQCARCAEPTPHPLSRSIHHRRNRGSGGSFDQAINLPSNLLLVCGTGTTGCHGWIGDHPAEALKEGYVVSLNSRHLPREVPVIHKVYGGSVFLLDDGTVRPVPSWDGVE